MSAAPQDMQKYRDDLEGRGRIETQLPEIKPMKKSILKKILMLSAAAALPFVLVAVFLMISMMNYSRTYDSIVRNMTTANNYNLNFKEEMDESLYKIVVGYVTFENISGEETLKNPYEMLEELRSEFAKLMDITAQGESRVWLESLLRNIDTLEKRVDDIVENVKAGGLYDENIKELDNNIYMLTELIQDDIQYYIYYQTQSMDKVTSALNQQMSRLIWVSGVLLVILVLLMAAATYRIATRILRPVRELYTATEKVAGGDFSVRASTDSGDEIAVLARGFNEMVGNMQTLVNKVKADQQRMRQTDLRLLQAQINPHFLYNTLDTIIWLIEGNKADEAVEMVVTLSEFFRLALSKGKELISLGEERQHISSYLEIQEVRYRDILEYDIQIAPSLYGYQILKLTLQPLVENALYHGIKYKRAKGYIHIKAEKDGDVLRLSVRDNGAGMEEEELRQLQREIKKPCQETEKGFGLANVNERIQMYFGPEYGMRIESQKDNGTYVEITIPAIERGVTEYGIAVGTDEKAKG